MHVDAFSRCVLCGFFFLCFFHFWDVSVLREKPTNTQKKKSNLYFIDVSFDLYGTRNAGRGGRPWLFTKKNASVENAQMWVWAIGNHVKWTSAFLQNQKCIDVNQVLQWTKWMLLSVNTSPTTCYCGWHSTKQRCADSFIHQHSTINSSLRTGKDWEKSCDLWTALHIYFCYIWCSGMIFVYK